MEESNSLDNFIAQESKSDSVEKDTDSLLDTSSLDDLDNVSLDKLISDDETVTKDASADNLADSVIISNSAQNSEFSSTGLGAPRPKLKKIKRLKIRPVSDTPVAPPKLSPDSSEKIDSVDDFADENQGTDLITINEAKTVSQENDFENSYVLEDLPPELDYVTGDNGEAIYPETGIMAYRKPIIIAFSCFLIGIFLGAIFFSTKTEEKHGLEDVILNPDVPQGRPRCGLTAREQACIFYIMNCYKQELTGRDFFKLAATLTGREEYMIETENLRYATMKIKPGAFAQLNIPALK